MNSRVILVTGGNGGLGRAIAGAFLAEAPSNFVWLAVHRNRTHADALVAAQPDRAACVDLDVTRPDSWKAGCRRSSTATSPSRFW